MRPANGTGTNVFALPPGYRPNAKPVFAVTSTDGLGHPAAGLMEIGDDGSVFIYATTDDRYISLDGITFYAES